MTAIRFRSSTCATLPRASASIAGAGADPASSTHRLRIACALLAICLPTLGHAQTPAWREWSGLRTASPAALPPRPQRSAGSAPVGLELRSHAGGIEVTAVNRLAGPVEVMLVADGVPPAAHPELPARAIVPGGGRVIVASLKAGAGGARLRLPAVPGLPTARPRDVTYVYPLRDAPVHVGQGYGGGFSHGDPENLHAVDFAAAPGTPVLAARDGLVMQVESDATGRLDPRPGHDPGDDRARGNFIRILHEDGTMALYAHLQHGGALVEAGTRVRRGTVIGFSGNTGLSAAPHLHFVVQANRGMRLESLPFRMTGPGGPLRFARVGVDAAPAAP